MYATQAVIFDRDNTLLAISPERLHALHAQLYALAPQLSIETVRDSWERWPGAWPRSVAEEPHFWHSFWSAISVTYSLSEATIATLTETFGRSYVTMFQAYPDAEPTLVALRQAGLRLAVLTNFELPSIDRTLQEAGLDPTLFELLLTRSTLGVAKPDPRAFTATAAALGLDPAQCCLVDDLPEHVAAARSLGMQAYCIDRTPRDGTPEPGCIASLMELVSLLVPGQGGSETSQA